MVKRSMGLLTRREREIVNVLFETGNRASAEEIRVRLVDPPSYSAVRALLARLEQKGQVRHAADGARSSTPPRPHLPRRCAPGCSSISARSSVGPAAG